MTKPRITTRHEIEPIDIASYVDPAAMTVGVLVQVTFDQGDHLDALRMLEFAVADVRRQIADAAEGSGA